MSPSGYQVQWHWRVRTAQHDPIVAKHNSQWSLEAENPGFFCQCAFPRPWYIRLFQIASLPPPFSLSSLAHPVDDVLVSLAGRTKDRARMLAASLLKRATEDVPDGVALLLAPMQHARYALLACCILTVHEWAIK